MEQAILNRKECEALAAFVNEHFVSIPDDEISDDLRSAASKIEAVTTSPAS